jgi:plasmid stabilization system protein ParE
MKVVFHEEALEEMLESASYYEERSAGLGWDFLRSVEQAGQRIVASPEAGPVLRGDVRKRLVAGFPFTLLYSIEPDHIFVVAVAHQSRRPGYWLKRVHV